MSNRLKHYASNEISEIFFLPQPSAIDSFYYPGYVKRLQKERQKQAKEKKIAQKDLCEKITTKTMSQSINS